MIKVKIHRWDPVESWDAILPGVPREGDEVLTPRGPIIIFKVVWRIEDSTVSCIGRSAL